MSERIDEEDDRTRIATPVQDPPVESDVPDTAQSPRALAIPVSEAAVQIRSTLAWKPGEHREVRIVSPSMLAHAVVSSPEEAVDAIKDVAYGKAAYITMNSIGSGSAVVRRIGSKLVHARKGKGISDSEIERRTCFVIDLDPERPTDTSSTEGQLAEARALAKTISDSLRKEGWPSPTEVCSGNGMHLYYRIDLDGGSDLPARALKGLAVRFSTTAVKVDTTVGNASRIMRMPGTWTAKGADRSLHRICTLEAVGEDIQLTRDQLEAVAVPASVQPTPPANSQPSTHNRSFDVDAWLQTHGVRHRGREPWPGGGAGANRWVLDVCAFNPTHNRGEAVITQQASGAVGFTCQHDSCSEHGWQEFRKVVESAAQARSVPSQSGARRPYPVDALPQLLQDTVRTQVDLTEVDEGSVAVPLLTAMLGVVGNSVVVEAWPGWNESMAAWTALVAPSGLMKSATVGLVENALQDLEAGFAPPSPDEPRERLVVNDTTVEALSDVGAKNPRGLIVYSDELAAWFRGIGQYKGTPGADEAFWLSAYEGRRHVVDRRSTGTTIVSRLLVSVVGGIQPPVLKEIMGERNLCESGFAARFWFIWPPRKMVMLRIPTEQLNTRLQVSRTRVRLCMQSLRTIPMQDGKPMTLRLEGAAREALRAFGQAQEEKAFLLPDLSVERSCRSKSRGWVAKLAGLIALLRAYEDHGVRQDGDPSTADYSSVTVVEADVHSAIRLVEWQLSENVRVHRHLRLDDLDLVLEHRDTLAREAMDPVTQVVTSRSYQRKHKVEAAHADEVLRGLVKAGLWGQRHPAPGAAGGRPTVEYFPLGDPSLC